MPKDRDARFVRPKCRGITCCSIGCYRGRTSRASLQNLGGSEVGQGEAVGVFHFTEHERAVERADVIEVAENAQQKFLI